MEQENSNVEETFEVMYNNKYGGFCFSKKALVLYCEKKGIPYEYEERFFDISMSNKIDRHDEVMIGIVKELGSEANGKNCSIKLERISLKYKDTYRIHEYDGLEEVDENKYIYDIETMNKKLEEENLSLKKEIQELKKEIQELKKKI